MSFQTPKDGRGLFRIIHSSPISVKKGLCVKKFFHVQGDFGVESRHVSSTDSDLEAFSHNPADGSIAPLPFQAGAYTKCLTQRFLSY